MPKTTKQTSKDDVRAALPVLPPKRARRRSTRASHSWCFRKPPSRKRVDAAKARGLPETIFTPALDLQPSNDSCN